MRRKLLAGNWKMNLTPNEARALIARSARKSIRDAATLARDRDVLIAPAAVAIPAVAQALAGSSIALGAQNMHYEDKGAFTGEVSAADAQGVRRHPRHPRAIPSAATSSAKPTS